MGAAYGEENEVSRGNEEGGASGQEECAIALQSASGKQQNSQSGQRVAEGDGHRQEHEEA